MDIYDRAGWPSPENNPLVQLLLGGDEWLAQETLVVALGLSSRRALISNATIFGRQIRDDDAAIVGRDFLTPGVDVTRAHGGTMRVYSRRALVFAAMRTNTVNAAAFRDWLATRAVEEASHG